MEDISSKDNETRRKAKKKKKKKHGDASKEDPSYDWQHHEQGSGGSNSLLGRIFKSKKKLKDMSQSDQDQDRRGKFLDGQRTEQPGALAGDASETKKEALSGPLHDLVKLETSP